MRRIKNRGRKFGSSNGPLAVMPVASDGAPDPILEGGRKLYEDAVKRSKQRGITVLAAFREIAGELPEPLRTVALETIEAHRPPDPILESAQKLFDDALRLSKQNGITVAAALREVAAQLPEPFRTAALEVIQARESRSGV